MTRRLSYTPQAIGAVLKRGGLSRSTSTPSRVRGIYTVTSGFRVRKGVEDRTMVVSWIPAPRASQDSIDQMVLRCEELLEDAGYAPARDLDNDMIRLVDTQEPLHLEGVPNGTMC